MRITEVKDLVPGILYCLFVTDIDANDEEWERDTAFVYWTGEGFMDEDGNDQYPEWDWAEPQSTTPDPQYIETRIQPQAQGRSDAYVSRCEGAF